MHLTQALPSDFPAVCALYQAVCAVMAREASPQWVWGEYPSEALLHKTLAAGTLYVVREGETLLGAVTVDTHFDPEYGSVAWRFGERPGAFHRLAVAPAAQGRGLGRQMIADVCGILREKGCDALRIDTYAPNTGAQRLYAAIGMRMAGEIRFAHRPLPFFCYELPL